MAVTVQGHSLTCHVSHSDMQRNRHFWQAFNYVRDMRKLKRQILHKNTLEKLKFACLSYNLASLYILF